MLVFNLYLYVCTYFVLFLMYLSSFHGELSITYLAEVENSMTRIRRCRSHYLNSGLIWRDFVACWEPSRLQTPGALDVASWVCHAGVLAKCLLLCIRILNLQNPHPC